MGSANILTATYDLQVFWRLNLVSRSAAPD